MGKPKGGARGLLCATEGSLESFYKVASALVFLHLLIDGCLLGVSRNPARLQDIRRQRFARSLWELLSACVSFFFRGFSGTKFELVVRRN